MNAYIFVILLGLIQGFTEFLPISSSGHLALLENIPYFDQMTAEIETEFSLLTFNVILHLGTILAVLIFWRRDIRDILIGFFKEAFRKEFRAKSFLTGKMIIVATVPILVVPFIKPWVDHVTETLGWLAVLFIYNGFMLMASDYFFHRKISGEKKEIHTLSIKDALLVGIFQVSAVFPGVSRSGSTITAGLLRGLSGPEAVKFSFLMSIPVLLAAAGLEAYEVRSSLELGTSPRWDWIIAGLSSSFLAGIFSLKALVWLGRKVIFYPFGIYTALLGVAVILLYL